MQSWQEQGCAACRQNWLSGKTLPEIAVNLKLHASLHRCESCGHYWQQLQRYAAVISEDGARKNFPQAFKLQK